MTDTKLVLLGILLTIALSGSLLLWIGYYKWRMHHEEQPRIGVEVPEGFKKGSGVFPRGPALDWPTWSVHSRPFDQEWD
jgi:hypothetical protein